MTQKANTWKVTTYYDGKVTEFWFPTEGAAQLAAKGFRLGGRTAVVTRDTRHVGA